MGLLMKDHVMFPVAWRVVTFSNSLISAVLMKVAFLANVTYVK